MLQLVLHHAVTDGWSTSLICRELTASYNAFVNGQQPVHPPLPVQYADYGGWQRTWLKQNVMQSQVALPSPSPGFTGSHARDHIMRAGCACYAAQATVSRAALLRSPANAWTSSMARPAEAEHVQAACVPRCGEVRPQLELPRTPGLLQLNFWREALAGAPPLWSFPTDFVRPAYPSGKGARVACTIAPHDVRKLRELSSQVWLRCFAAACKHDVQQRSGVLMTMTPRSQDPVHPHSCSCKGCTSLTCKLPAESGHSRAQSGSTRLTAWRLQSGATMFMVLLTAFKILLARHILEQDLVVGVPHAGRSMPDFENLVGPFMGAVGIRSSFARPATFLDMLRHVRQVSAAPASGHLISLRGPALSVSLGLLRLVSTTLCPELGVLVQQLLVLPLAEHDCCPWASLGLYGPAHAEHCLRRWRDPGYRHQLHALTGQHVNAHNRLVTSSVPALMPVWEQQQSLAPAPRQQQRLRPPCSCRPA